MAQVIQLDALPSQLAFLGETSRVHAFIGGIRSGKTVGGGMKSTVLCVQFPRAIGLIMANSFTQLRDYTLRAFFEILKRCKIHYWHKETKKKILIRVRDQWAEVHYRSADNYLDIEGGEYGWIWIDEARRMARKIFDTLMGRLSSPFIANPMLFLTTTPNGFDWVHDILVDNPVPGSKFVLTNTAQNRFLPEGYVQSLLDTYDPLLARQELHGEFLNTTAGRLYHQFVRDDHVRDVRASKALPLVLCWDFNINPMSVTVVQQVDDDTVAVDEIVLPNSTVWDVCNEFKRRYPFDQWRRGLHIYGDASGSQRHASSNTTCWDIVKQELSPFYAGFEFKVQRANPSVPDRVNAVNARFRSATGKIRVHITPKCKSLISDCEKMTMMPGTNMPDKRDKERSHSMDGFGYYIHDQFPVGGVQSWSVSPRRG